MLGVYLFINNFVTTNQHFLIMKKLLYLFLVLPLIFSSCKKDDDDDVVTPVAVSGCMDAVADNYNSNATTEPNNACNYSAEVVYFLYKSASDAMILNLIPYVYFYDSFGNNLGTLTYQYYYDNMANVLCSTGNGRLYVQIEWSGNKNSNSASFTYDIYLDDGSYFATDSFVVNPNLCHKVGFSVTPAMAEKLKNR